MALTKEKKNSLVQEYRTNPKDSGSTPIQIAMLTERIQGLLDHFKKSPKDHASRQGLLKMVGHRRQLLNYLRKIDKVHYENVIQRLDLRK